MQFVIIFALIVAIFAVIFALQNASIVSLHFILWDFEGPLALYLLIAMAVGAVIIAIFTIPNWLRKKKDESQHRKNVAELEDNLSKYRSNLIDAQNNNKDLRLKIIEVEQSRGKLEMDLNKEKEANEGLRSALTQADESVRKAEQEKKDVEDTHMQMQAALHEMELKLNHALDSAAIYREQLNRIQLPEPFKIKVEMPEEVTDGEVVNTPEAAAEEPAPEAEATFAEAVPETTEEAAEEPAPEADEAPAEEAPAAETADEPGDEAPAEEPADDQSGEPKKHRWF